MRLANKTMSFFVVNVFTSLAARIQTAHLLEDQKKKVIALMERQISPEMLHKLQRKTFLAFQAICGQNSSNQGGWILNLYVKMKVETINKKTLCLLKRIAARGKFMG